MSLVFPDHTLCEQPAASAALFFRASFLVPMFAVLVGRGHVYNVFTI